MPWCRSRACRSHGADAGAGAGAGADADADADATPTTTTTTPEPMPTLSTSARRITDGTPDFRTGDWAPADTSVQDPAHSA